MGMAHKIGIQNAGGRVYSLATRQTPEARLRVALRRMNHVSAELRESAAKFRSEVSDLDATFADLALGMSRYQASLNRINVSRLRRASTRLAQFATI